VEASAGRRFSTEGGLGCGAANQTGQKMETNSRERWLAALAGKAVDPPVRWEAHGYAPETVAAWCDQGLAADDSPDSWFQLDNVEWVPLYWGPLPTADTRTLFDDARAGVWHRPPASCAGLGRTPATSFPNGPPVRNELQFALAKRCYNAYSPCRYEACGTQRRFPDRPAALVLPGFLRWAEELLKPEYVAEDLATDGARLTEAAEYYFLFLQVTLRTFFDKGEADLAFLPEASSELAAAVALEWWEKLCQPGYAALADTLAAHDTHLLTELPTEERRIAAWLEAGVRGFYAWPNGPAWNGLEMRERLGERVTIIGGLRTESLLGSYEEIEQEVERIIRPLAAAGRFVASLERAVPPDVDLHHYRAYCDWVRRAPGPPPRRRRTESEGAKRRTGGRKGRGSRRRRTK